jgi:hypothetical protein
VEWKKERKKAFATAQCEIEKKKRGGYVAPFTAMHGLAFRTLNAEDDPRLWGSKKQHND